MQNQLNQYTAVDDDEPTYDADGNMLTNGDWSYTWNGENRLVRAENAVTGAALEFDYDYMGRRIYKKVYNGTVLEKHLLFVYDGYKLIEERDALDGGSLVRRYAWQPEVLGRDVPLMVHDAASNATYYYHTDAKKNVTESTDESGAVVAHYEYSPFGTVTRATGSFAADNPFRFSSEYSDAETGLIYYNYRYYSPELGRWLSRDPIGEEGGINLYVMIENKPLTLMDRLGLKRWYVTGLHSCIIVETWNEQCEPNGYVRIEFGAAYNSLQTWLTAFMFAKGCVYITPVSGHNNWYTYQLDTSCNEDKFLLEWARQMEKDPPWYNAPAFNCHAFTIYAWTVGLAE